MKVLMINSVCGIRSTGRICTDLAKALESRGHTVKIAYGRGSVPEEYKKYAYRIGNNMDVMAHGLSARINDCAGLRSQIVTKKLINWIEEYNPDLIHLHNLHGYYLNVPLLFEYLAQSRKKVIWTLHDCWPFTGHCCYFDYAGCEKWKTGCRNCPQKRNYPASIVDRSEDNYGLKKELFNGLPEMTLVTPSFWLKSLVEQSYLNKYPITVIHNWVDLDRFRKTDNEVKKALGIEDKNLVLGVSSGWEKRKGLNDFLLLNEQLDDDYQIVLLGLSNKQLKSLPESIIGIKQTNSVYELAQFYSAADVYVNPTYEDNYPSTNLEAIACGTPVITYDTGGSGESADLYGVLVEKGNVCKLADAIRRIIDYSGKDFPNLHTYNDESLSAYISLIEDKES